MSAIARFLVEFEPSPAPPHGPTPAVFLPAPSASADDGDTIEGLDDDGFGLVSEPGTDDLEQDDGFGVGSTDTALAEPSWADPSAADTSAAEAVAAAEAGFSERILALEEDHARARAEDRTRWTQGEGSTLAEGFRKATAEMEERLIDAVAAVLEPLMADVVKSAALRELRQAIVTLTTGGSSAKIEVTGPEDLVEALRSAFGAAGGDMSGMTFAPSQDAEVTVTADNSTIRTRLAEWAASFEGSLGSDA